MAMPGPSMPEAKVWSSPRTTDRVPESGSDGEVLSGLSGALGDLGVLGHGLGLQGGLIGVDVIASQGAFPRVVP